MAERALVKAICNKEGYMYLFIFAYSVHGVELEHLPASHCPMAEPPRAISFHFVHLVQ